MYGDAVAERDVADIATHPRGGTLVDKAGYRKLRSGVVVGRKKYGSGVNRADHSVAGITSSAKFGGAYDTAFRLSPQLSTIAMASEIARQHAQTHQIAFPELRLLRAGVARLCGPTRCILSCAVLTNLAPGLRRVPASC